MAFNAVTLLGQVSSILDELMAIQQSVGTNGLWDTLEDGELMGDIVEAVDEAFFDGEGLDEAQEEAVVNAVSAAAQLLTAFHVPDPVEVDEE